MKICTVQLERTHLTEEELKVFQEFNPGARFINESDIFTHESYVESKFSIKRADFDDEKWSEYKQKYAADEAAKTDNEGRLQLSDKNGGHSAVVEITQFMDACPTLSFKVERTHKITVPELPGNLAVIGRVKEMEEVSERVQALVKSFPTMNDKCNVHIGGGLLLTVNETCYHEDMCTDELQGMLDQDWRLLAVCVQPDGRRPDYVFGRYNPEKN